MVKMLPRSPTTPNMRRRTPHIQNSCFSNSLLLAYWQSKDLFQESINKSYSSGSASKMVLLRKIWKQMLGILLFVDWIISFSTRCHYYCNKTAAQLELLLVLKSKKLIIFLFLGAGAPLGLANLVSVSVRHKKVSKSNNLFFLASTSILIHVTCNQRLTTWFLLPYTCYRYLLPGIFTCYLLL